MEQRRKKKKKKKRRRKKEKEKINKEEERRGSKKEVYIMLQLRLDLQTWCLPWVFKIQWLIHSAQLSFTQRHVAAKRELNCARPKLLCNQPSMATTNKQATNQWFAVQVLLSSEVCMTFLWLHFHSSVMPWVTQQGTCQLLLPR